ncbi:cupin domain-containing protein [Pseudazoarcus pumilus]|uniref:Cupin domain-containing protein n=1 Tax=Pseudazoarcus pumilus TaxID=2067960 RepID=A0A2I6S9R2_9RHOO|nr:cupin domain-containing protein [Pseudazoarcus pumilus]AUN95989.1 cupin domain-containing protein [Pseudazoarcus pumilus]
MKIACTLFAFAAFAASSAWADATPQLEASKIEAKVLTRTTQSWDGSALPTYPRAQPEISIMRYRIPAGAALPMHKHPVINAGVLLAGELTVISEDGDTLHMKAGDTIVELVDKWHYGRNEGDTTAEIVVFYAGIGGLPVVEKQ